MRLKNRVIFFGLIIALMIIPIRFLGAETCIHDNKTTLIITITDATYFCAESDGLENDVIAYFTLEVYKSSEHSCDQVVFYLLVSMTLPSGLEYNYLYRVTSYYNVIADIIIIFYDHATEPGWYLLEITGILVYGHPTYSVGTESFYFDPPGGSEGTTPGGGEIRQF